MRWHWKALVATQKMRFPLNPLMTNVPHHKETCKLICNGYDVEH